MRQKIQQIFGTPSSSQWNQSDTDSGQQAAHCAWNRSIRRKLHAIQSISPNNQRNSISSGEENSFFIDNQDGTYDLYITGQYIETIDSLEYYDQTIPIYDSIKEALHDETK